MVIKEMVTVIRPEMLNVELLVQSAGFNSIVSAVAMELGCDVEEVIDDVIDYCANKYDRLTPDFIVMCNAYELEWKADKMMKENYNNDYSRYVFTGAKTQQHIIDYVATNRGDYVIDDRNKCFIRKDWYLAAMLELDAEKAPIFYVDSYITWDDYLDLDYIDNEDLHMAIEQFRDDISSAKVYSQLEEVEMLAELSGDEMIEIDDPKLFGECYEETDEEFNLDDSNISVSDTFEVAEDCVPEHIRNSLNKKETEMSDIQRIKEYYAKAKTCLENDAQLEMADENFLSIFGDEMEVGFTYRGHNVFVVEDDVLGDENVLVAASVNRFINDGVPFIMISENMLTRLPMEYLDAILAHEAGHIELGHLERVVKTLTFGRDWSDELEADAFSRILGHDIAGALKWFNEYFFTTEVGIASRESDLGWLQDLETRARITALGGCYWRA